MRSPSGRAFKIGAVSLRICDVCALFRYSASF